MSTDLSRGSRGRKRGALFAALLALALAALVAAGCGDDDDGNGAGGGDGSSDAVAQAEEVIAPFLEPPESVGTDVPLSKTPEKGKHVIAISCQLDVCAAFRDDVATGAKELGWTADSISFDGTPEDTLAKVNQAVNSNPDGIIINGVPRETYEQAWMAAEEAGIPIVTQMGELEGEPTGPFIAVQYQADKFDVMAEATGNWVIADSGGTGHALTLSYANFPLSERIAETTKATIDESCPDCQTTALRAQAEDTGTRLPGQVVSEIQRDPSINYVVMQDAAMSAGLEAALREAGLLDKVKVLGNNVTAEAIQAVVDGSFLGLMAFSTRVAAWHGVDALARHFNGDEQQDVPLMNQILTQETLPPNPTEDDYNDIPPDFEDQYREMWGLG